MNHKERQIIDANSLVVYNVKIINLTKVIIYLLTSCNTKERIVQNIYIHYEFYTLHYSIYLYSALFIFIFCTILSLVLQEVKRKIITFVKFNIYPLAMIALCKNYVGREVWIKCYSFLNQTIAYLVKTKG